MAKNEKALKIKVIGTGGIGLCILPTLCRYLAFEKENFPSVDISLIDGDTFEEKNRARQEFTDIGPKATVTTAKYQDEFPQLTFWPHPTYVADHNVIPLIREGDIVLLCVDNHKTRKLISDRACDLKNITVISGGNDWTDGNVLIHVRRDDVNLTPPLANNMHLEIVNPTDKNPGDVEEKAAGCAVLAVSSPQLLIMNNMIAANMLAAFYNVVNPERFAEVMKKPENFGEVYSDIETLKTEARPRPVAQYEKWFAKQ